MTIYILLILAAVGTGMAISVYAFGTGGKRKRIFQDIYFSVEDNEGVGVVYTKNGEYAAILRMENPVDKYSADIDGYYEYTRLFTAIAEADVNLRMIDQGSSELNIIIGVDEADFEKAISAVYRAFCA